MADRYPILVIFAGSQGCGKTTTATPYSTSETSSRRMRRVYAAARWHFKV